MVMSTVKKRTGVIKVKRVTGEWEVGSVLNGALGGWPHQVVISEHRLHQGEGVSHLGVWKKNV